MDKIEEYIDFVNSQLAFHSKRAANSSYNSTRQLLHKQTADKFSNLKKFLENCKDNTGHVAFDKPRQLSLSWEEIDGLPEELLSELSVTDSDKLDYSIVSLVDQSGGVATLDRILVALYKTNGEIIKRSTLNARLYRMAQKDMIYSVPGKKGVYSTKPLTEEEIALLK